MMLDFISFSTNLRVQLTALADENVQRFVSGKQIKKTAVVPGKLVNIVVVE